MVVFTQVQMYAIYKYESRVYDRLQIAVNLAG